MPLRTISKKSHCDPAATLNRLADRVKYASTAQCVTIVQDGLLWKWPLGFRRELGAGQQHWLPLLGRRPAKWSIALFVLHAWHDCYGEITPSEELVDDILLCSKGKLAQLIRVARQAVSDWRDVKVAAAEIRTAGKSN
jgi:hypothetical protein